jgi:transposase
VEGNRASGFASILESLGGKWTVVLEACWSWERVYEQLESLGAVEEIVLANALQTRLIAQAQVKTDKVDARALARLLRGGLIPRVHVPAKAVRQRKAELRQRLYWARLRTRVRNRLHALLDRHPDLPLPACSDLFGVAGMKALKELHLPSPDAVLLEESLALLELLGQQMRDQEKRIARANRSDPVVQRLQSVPGLGPIFAAVVAAEIDDATRFAHASQLCAYAGLVPTTHSSGGHTYHGKLLWAANKWLRWALIEAAWVAIARSAYFGTLYRAQRARGKKANVAITIVARRMCRILWQLLTRQRDYQENDFPGRSRETLTVPLNAS